MDVQKIRKGSPFYTLFFGTMPLIGDFKKNSKEIFRNFFFHSGTVEENTWHFKVLCYFWALDMARTSYIWWNLMNILKRLGLYLISTVRFKNKLNQWSILFENFNYLKNYSVLIWQLQWCFCVSKIKTMERQWKVSYQFLFPVTKNLIVLMLL